MPQTTGQSRPRSHGRPHAAQRLDMTPVEILTPKEAAAWLKCSMRALYMRVARMQVPYRKDGWRLVFLRSELEAFVRNLPRYDVLPAGESADGPDEKH